MDKPFNKKFAILVHELPVDRYNDALTLLPYEDIEGVSYSDYGMRVFFKQWKGAKRCLCKQRSIRVGGQSYDVCALQSSLTFHGVREYFLESTIRDLMALLGPVSDLYPVATISKDGRGSVSNDYTVILDVPEVLANFSLAPLQFGIHSFEVSFFCRICSRNEHKCMDHSETALWNESASSSYERPSPSYEIPRRQELPNKRYNSSEYNNESARINISPEEFEEKHDALGHGGAPYRAGFGQTEMSAASPFVKSEFSHSSISDDSQTGEDHSTSLRNGINIESEQERGAVGYGGSPFHFDHQRMAEADKFELAYSDPAPWTDVRVDNPGQKRNDYPGPENRGKASGNRLSDRESERNQRRRETETKDINWLQVIPHHLDYGRTIRLLHALLDGQKVGNASGCIGPWLREVLDWNHDQVLREEDRRFLDELQFYLDKIEAPSKSNNLKDELPIKKTVTKKTTKPTKRKHLFELSPGIENIVSKTKGVLTPTRLRNFLQQVRGRKKQLEVAANFTYDISALVRQLKAVEKNYYVSGKRGTREDLDIQFIVRLYFRLEERVTSLL